MLELHLAHTLYTFSLYDRVPFPTLVAPSSFSRAACGQGNG